MATEKIMIGIDDQIIELKGENKEAFIADRQERVARIDLVETEYKAKQEARDSAIKKLAEIAGLTKEEINAIL